MAGGEEHPPLPVVFGGSLTSSARANRVVEAPDGTVRRQMATEQSLDHT